MESRIFDDKISKFNFNEFDSLPDVDYLESEYRKDISYLINNPKFYIDGERLMYVSKYQMAGVYGLFKGKYPLYNFSKSFKQFIDVFKIENKYSPLFYNLNMKYYYDLYLSLKRRMNFFNKLVTKKIKHIYYDDSHGRMSFFLFDHIVTNKYDTDIDVYPISYNENSLVWKKLVFPKECVLMILKKQDRIFDNIEKKIEISAFLFSVSPREDFTKLYKNLIRKNPSEIAMVLNFYIEDVDESEYSNIFKKSIDKFETIKDDYFIAIKITDIDKLKSII